jgi:DNA-directed RNA polymerase sigma subunit (sigma70/sigma32)
MRIPYKKRSHEEIAADVAAAQAGDIAARNRVIAHNMRLVVKHAHAFAQRVGRMDLLDDLVQAASIGDESASGATRRGGILRAIETYDASHGTKFSTHARSWILLEIRRALSRQGMLRTDTVRRHALITRVRDELAIELGEDPTHEQIMAEWRKRGYPDRRCTPAAIDRALGRVGRTVSFDALTDPSDDERAPAVHGNGRAIDADPAALGEGDIIAHLDRGLDAQRALACLTDRERIVVIALFGIGQDQISVADFAKSRGVGPRKIRGIRDRALQKMRTAMSGDSA